LETFRWDIIRIQLPQPAAAGSYPSWWAFRDAVITLAREQVQTSDYDVNGDGVIDVVWSIVSNGEADVPFALGGASRNAGANLFVDGQASGSVTAGATGNFNHEVGHCLGLPDMYGPYTTLNKLTFMADSWALPPQDFSAYERVKLGWLKPHVVQATTIGVWLPSAHEELAAVMIPTGRSPEYFLIEYRNPPATGYGSAGPDYKGLAVYHVLEGSSMGQDPPLVKLEPADGGIVPNQEVDPNDYAYPENLVLLRPMVLRSYYNDRDEVFRIENVVWRDGGLAFDLVMAAPLPRTNLLTNASFETGWPPDRPDGWSPESFGTTGVTFVWPSPLAAHGESSALLASSGYDAWWRQTVTGLTSGQPYLLCGALKGEAIQDMDGHIGAHVSLLDGFVRSEGLFGTFGWTNSCVRFTAQTSQVDVACRLGRFGSGVSGKLWCDDFTLEYALLGSAFLP
jgi:M6 family metalloprotease-like protein